MHAANRQYDRMWNVSRQMCHVIFSFYLFLCMKKKNLFNSATLYSFSLYFIKWIRLSLTFTIHNIYMQTISHKFSYQISEFSVLRVKPWNCVMVMIVSFKSVFWFLGFSVSRSRLTFRIWIFKNYANAIQYIKLKVRIRELRLEGLERSTCKCGWFDFSSLADASFSSDIILLSTISICTIWIDWHSMSNIENWAHWKLCGKPYALRA